MIASKFFLMTKERSKEAGLPKSVVQVDRTPPFQITGEGFDTSLRLLE
jgi:hypothetical protein